jgi:hypothetical protein
MRTVIVTVTESLRPANQRSMSTKKAAEEVLGGWLGTVLVLA